MNKITKEEAAKIGPFLYMLLSDKLHCIDPWWYLTIQQYGYPILFAGKMLFSKLLFQMKNGTWSRAKNHTQNIY